MPTAAAVAAMKYVGAFAPRYPARKSHRPSGPSVPIRLDAASSVPSSYRRRNARWRTVEIRAAIRIAATRPTMRASVRMAIASSLEAVATEPRHPHQSDRLKGDHGSHEHRPDAGLDERLQSIGVGAPHEKCQHIGDEQHDCDRGMRLHALRANAARELEPIAHGAADGRERRGEAAAHLPVNRERRREEPEGFERYIDLQIADRDAWIVTEADAAGHFLQGR